MNRRSDGGLLFDGDDYCDVWGTLGFSSFDANSGVCLLLGINYVWCCDNGQIVVVLRDDFGTVFAATLLNL